jgi:hypothetical protein
MDLAVVLKKKRQALLFKSKEGCSLQRVKKIDNINPKIPLKPDDITVSSLEYLSKVK